MHNRMMDVDEYLRTSFEDAGALTETLRTENPTIEIPLAQALDINS